MRDATHISLAPAGPAALDAGDEELTRPLFRSSPPVPPPSVAAPAAAAALAGAAVGAGAAGSSAVGSGGSGPSDRGEYGEYTDYDKYDEFENFQPGSDLPPPVFPMNEPVEPVDRGRIVRYALSAVVLAALCVVAFVGLTQKGSGKKTAAAPGTSSSTSPANAGSSTSPSSANPGAVTAPTATDSAPASSTTSKPPSTPSTPSTSAKPTPPPSSAPKTSAVQTSAAPPPPPQTTHQQPPLSGGVRSLSVSLAPDSTGSFTYIAHVHVTTNGTGSVTVTVTFAGTATSGSPGSTGAQTQSFPLSGKTSYDIYAQSDVHGMCIGSGDQPYIDAIASASGADSSAAYASSPC
jgi:cell division septation protein DedD